MREQKELSQAVKEEEKGRYSELCGHLLCDSGQSPSRVCKAERVVILPRAVKHGTFLCFIEMKTGVDFSTTLFITMQVLAT